MMAKSKVAEICRVKPQTNSWVNRLSPEQRKLAEDVRREVIQNGLPKRPIAQNLVDELDLIVSAQTVALWFREASK